MSRNDESSRDRGGRDRGRGDNDRGGRDRGGREESSRGSRSSSRDDDSRGSSRGGRSERSGSSYEYQERDAAATKKRGSQGSNDFDKILIDGAKMWTPADGDNRIRILPPTWEGAKHFGLDLSVHYGVGPDRQSYLDLTKMKGEPDPITEEWERARRDGDEDYAKELSSRKRVLVYLIDRDHPKDGVQAWAMPQTIDRDIIKVSVDKSSGEVLSIDHPEEGYDVEFEKTGKGLNTKYLAVSIARRSTPLGDSAWLDYAVDNPLPTQLNYFDYDHIAKVFGGGGAAPKGRDRDDDRDDDRGRDSKRGSARDDDDAPRSKRNQPEDDAPRNHGRAAPAASDEPTWDSVHAMTGDELEDLVDQEKLDIDPKEAKDDEDLADWICEEMKLKKVEAKTSRRASAESNDSQQDRLAKMRAGRRD